jgi:hypothetical protein
MERMERDTEQTTGGRRGTTAARGDVSTRSSDMPATRADVPMGDAASPAPQDHEEAIRRRAYEIYESRGGSPGNELDDWYAAEQEIRGARGADQL